jgi:hypothetical protein
MTDPVFLIAVAGLGLSAIVSGIRLINWFLRSDPKGLAHAGRWSVLALFALSLPLLLGLAVNQRWVEAIGLSAVLLLGFALYGPRVLGQLFPRRLVADFGPASAARDASEAADPEVELVRRSIAVLEDYLRRTAGSSGRDGAHLHGNTSQISHAGAHRNGGGHDARVREREFRSGKLDPPSMSETEALEVLGIGPGATEADITESHRRLMQLIHPDRGGSPYFAVKVNQAKDVLLGRGRSQDGRGAGSRRRRRPASHLDISQSNPATGG